MSVSQLLSVLQSHDVRLSVVGSDLIIDAPIGVLTDELRDQIRCSKANLLVALSAETIDLPEPNLCPRCLTEGTISTGFEGENGAHPDKIRIFNCVDTTFGDRRHTWLIYRSGRVQS